MLSEERIFHFRFFRSIHMDPLYIIYFALSHFTVKIVYHNQAFFSLLILLYIPIQTIIEALLHLIIIVLTLSMGLKYQYVLPGRPRFMLPLSHQTLDDIVGVHLLAHLFLEIRATPLRLSS